jgi:hypothetical protein
VPDRSTAHPALSSRVARSFLLAGSSPKHHPGYELAFQKLSAIRSRHFDVLTLFSEADELVDVYFDVSALFSKGRFKRR